MKATALRGVNLGGWLIVERWMTPSLFKGLDAGDEYTLSATEKGRERIRQHRQDFITEEDWQWLAKHNVELVRIPFGYWLFHDVSPYVGGTERLDWAMEMAEKYQIKVLLDIHALPGSQNGSDHSGKSGETQWFSDEQHQKDSLDVCVRVAERYKSSPVLWGVEIINEPMFSWRTQVALRRYYRNAYGCLMKILPDHIYVIFSDAWRPWFFAGALRTHRSQRVAMDIHWYSSGAKWQKFATVSAYYRQVQRRVRELYWLQKIHPVIIGEWSMMLAGESAMKREGKALHEAEIEHLKEQLAVYQYALAHIYWSYKTEFDGGWNYRFLTEKGVIKMTDSATLK